MRTVLIVDDDAALRRALAVALGDHGYRAAEAADGAAALGWLGRERADAVLLDLRMPGMDGMEVLRRIRALPELAGVPIIAVTSYALSGDEAKTRAAGCDGYVAKPFSPRQLLAKIREFLPE